MGYEGPRHIEEDAAARASLSTTVERAYVVFNGFKPGLQLSICRCGLCMDEGIEKFLLKTPLREIDDRLLAEYNWAIDAPGKVPFDHGELRYFLPRFLELIAEEQYPHFADPALTLRRLGTANYRANWTRNQVEVLDTYFGALLDLHLSRPIGIGEQCDGRRFPCSNLDDDILCLCAHGGADLTALMTRWETTPSVTAIQHRAALAYRFARSEELGYDFPGPFWDALPEQKAALRAWVKSPKTAACVAQVLQTEGDADVRSAWQLAQDNITAP